MIKPVTFKAAQNFKANLYALGVRSGFTNPDNANGYYEGYGADLGAIAVSTAGIRISSGVLLVQGRMAEIISSETVPIAYQEGKLGYIICRIETSPAQGTDNCSLLARTGAQLSEIALTQEDTYAYASESANRVYELPIYSFAMQNNQITNITKLIKPVSGLRIHQISFDVKTNASGTLDARIYCDLPVQKSNPFVSIADLTQWFWQSGRKTAQCYGYYADGKKIPCFLEYKNSGSAALMLSGINTEIGGMFSILLSMSVIDGFSDTVLST